ncbi:MAG TPA: hypothetical protein VFK59_02755 [Actinomycetota bacterium]|nr:hypothetical protein [Actinomycetota bacterium]
MSGPSWPRVANHRGRSVPVTLGAAVAGAGALGAAVVVATREVPGGGVASTIGCGLVFAAGFVDDLSSGGPRGISNHLRELLRMHVTTGVVKLLVITASAIVVGGSLPGRGSATVAGVVLMAAGANLWNGLDVRPGRALKAFLPVAAVVLLAGPPLELVPPLPGVVVGAALVLPADLRERGVLGDGGSNLLGFVAGLGLYLVLPTWGVWLGAACAVTLNVLAETVTLSRMIAAVAAIRWYDGLGRTAPRD